MAAPARVFKKRYSSIRAARLAKLPEGPLHMRGQVTRSVAIPAQVRLVEGRAIERGHKVAARGIAAVSLALRQFFAQSRYPAAERTQKASPQIGFFKHQPQHLPGLASIVHLLSQQGQNRILESGQGFAALWGLRKPLRHPLTEVLHAEGEQLLLGAEIAEKCAPGDARVATDFLYRRPVETDRAKQFPGSPLNLPKHELMFPFAKRTGILRFRPLFAARRANRFLHCMQIMAQSVVL
jgi:hypothetical protein